MSDQVAARAAMEQLAASDPAVSAFVDASAGSGKTKVLTDRLLRLMLGGADPARIQCLTFTKAAAAEMSLRLQRRLGDWVTLPEPALDAALKNLDLPPDDGVRAAARALFARVLDLPGGMRIGTIHAFCQSLLRRFPLEAALSPHFQVLETVDAALAWRDARERMLTEARSPDAKAALETLAGLTTLDQFGKLVTGLQTDRDRLRQALALGPGGIEAAQRRALGVTETSREKIVAGNVVWAGEAAVRRAAEKLLGGSPTIADRAVRLLGWLGLETAERAENWHEWVKEFVLDSGRPWADSRMVNDKLGKTDPTLLATMQMERSRVLAVEEKCRALEVAAVSAALLRLAGPVVDFYAGQKDATGRLDYADMIGRTVGLLRDPGTAWVLYKLDGGLDHLLLDEVQDTSPEQWSIAHSLTEEFFSGAGAREVRRTVFAVGDLKQSIYSFQGADPAAFQESREAMKARVQGAGRAWRQTALDVSFRSTAPVLALVDEVFKHPAAAEGVVAPGQTLTHHAFRAGAAGAVELWPLVPSPAPPEPPSWTVPERYDHRVSAPQFLADALAEWIDGQVGKVMLESQGRLLAAGDFLILVRRRDDLSREIVRALKQKGVAVAGLDRMVLTAQPAVADLLALCDALLLPQDDLSLACVLTSPLGGLTDDALMALAMGRRGSLWDNLRRRGDERDDWRRAQRFLAALFGRVDYATPHALLAEALGPLGGRAALLARLGPEAAEPIDELLSAALAFAAGHTPSLQGFVQWLRQSGAEVKREAEGAGDSVRVMTVHGAKGLQAPVVILPDTTGLPPDDGPLLWATDLASGLDVPIWSPRKEIRCAAADTLRQEAAARRLAEYNRLLYVALTRAEDRLLVCGCDTRRGMPENCWYDAVERVFGSLAGVETGDAAPFPEAGPVRRVTSRQSTAIPPSIASSVGGLPKLPDWAGRAPSWQPLPPPVEENLARPLAPSRPQDGELGPVPRANSPLAARNATNFGLRRGQLLHALLQHLPELPPGTWRAAAENFLARPGNFLTPGQVASLAAETVDILENAELAPLFGPGSRAEVPLTGTIAGSIIGGLVDRLAVLTDRVIIADYKTNRDPPGTLDATPVLYLRQMAAYRAVLAGVFPDRRIDCALIWTQAARVAWLPSSLLDRHAPGLTGPAAFPNSTSANQSGPAP